MTLARNSIYALAGQVVPLLVALATIPYFLELIGAERYGALALAWLILGYFGSADFGIGRAITQRIAAMRGEAAGDMATAVWSALVTMLFFSLFGAALLFGFATWYFANAFAAPEGLRGEALDAVWILALCNPVVAIIGVLGGALMGLERFRRVAVSNVATKSLMLLLPLILAVSGKVELPLLILASLAARLLGIAILGSAVWRQFLRGRSLRFDRAEFLRLAKFGGWIMLTTLVGPLMVYADRFLIGAVMSAAAVAAYAIPYDIANRTLMLPIAIAQALFPRLAADTDEQARHRMRDFTVFIALLFTPVVVVLVCLAGPLLRLWLGDALDLRSIAVAQLVLAGCWANAIANVPYAFIQARGDPRYTALLHLVELPVYVTLLAILGLRFGLAGFAAAFALRCALDCVLLLRRAHTLDALTLRSISAPFLLVALALAAGYSTSAPQALVIVALALGTVALALLLLRPPASVREELAHLPLRWRR